MTHISIVIWYPQKLRAFPAHSMMMEGLSPPSTFVFQSSGGLRKFWKTSYWFGICVLQAGHSRWFRSSLVRPDLTAQSQQ